MARTIVITGAGDGLGRALARRFASDGDTVVLMGRTLAKLEVVAQEIGERHLAVQCEIGDPDSVRAAFARIAERHPRIDVLINNAAIFEPFSLAEAEDAKIMEMMLTNLAGPIFCTREALKLLGRGGHVINVSSESVRLKFPLLWLYEATKTALEHLSESVGRDIEADGIRMSVVRAGQMIDETKSSPAWPADVAMRFYERCVAAGIHIRERPLAHYNSVAVAIRSVIDSPADVHIPFVALSAWRP